MLLACLAVGAGGGFSGEPLANDAPISDRSASRKFVSSFDTNGGIAGEARGSGDGKGQTTQKRSLALYRVLPPDTTPNCSLQPFDKNKM